MRDHNERIDEIISSLHELKQAFSGEPVAFPDNELPPAPYDFKDVYELIDSIVEELGSMQKNITLKHVYSLTDELDKNSTAERKQSTVSQERQQDLFTVSDDVDR